MSHCSHHHSHLIDLGFSPEGFGIIAILFITGFISSFTHCIGMCGSVALAQANMRLMHLQSAERAQTARWQLVFATPYYLGKALTYTLLAASAYLLSSNPAMHSLRPIAAIALFAMCFVMLLGVLNKGINLPFLKRITNTYSKFISAILKKLSFLNLNPFGLKGFAYGMILGFIPCNLVFMIITAAVTNSANILVLSMAVMAFGLATIPGLFLFAYFGQHFLSKNKTLFNIAYNVIIILNVYLISKYALRLL